MSTPSKQAVVTPMLKKRSGRAKLSFGPQSKPNSVIKFSFHLSRVYFGVRHSQTFVTFGSLQSATGSSIRKTFWSWKIKTPYLTEIGKESTVPKRFFHFLSFLLRSSETRSKFFRIRFRNKESKTTKIETKNLVCYCCFLFQNLE